MHPAPPQVPDHPLTMRELAYLLNDLHTFVQANMPGTRSAELRGNPFKRAREAYHAFLFASAYAKLFGVGHTLTVQVKEEADRDATLRWMNGKTAQVMRLQLKELVSPRVNPVAESAEEEIRKLLPKLPGNAPDLTVAIFLNYGNRYKSTFVLPAHVKIKELWMFGYSKPDSSELFIAGGVNDEHRFFVPTLHILDRPS